MSRERVEPVPGGILGLLRDRANLLTMLGLACGVLAIYFAALQVFEAAMIALLWATFIDWFDGPIARRMRGRSPACGAFGRELDSLTDLVCHGVAPAVVLLSFGRFSPSFLPGALLVVGAGAARLGYFNVFDREDSPSYLGLPIDSNSIVIALVFLLEHLWGRDVFAMILYATIVGLAVLNVTPFHMPKPRRLAYPALAAFVICLTAVYGWRLWAPTS